MSLFVPQVYATLRGSGDILSPHAVSALNEIGLCYVVLRAIKFGWKVDRFTCTCVKPSGSVPGTQHDGLWEPTSVASAEGPSRRVSYT